MESGTINPNQTGQNDIDAISVEADEDLSVEASETDCLQCQEPTCQESQTQSPESNNNVKRGFHGSRLTMADGGTLTLKAQVRDIDSRPFLSNDTECCITNASPTPKKTDTPVKVKIDRSTTVRRRRRVPSLRENVSTGCKCTLSKPQERALLSGLLVGLAFSFGYITWIFLDDRFLWAHNTYGDAYIILLKNHSLSVNSSDYNATWLLPDIEDFGTTLKPQPQVLTVKLRRPVFIGLLSLHGFLSSRGAACNATWAKSSELVQVEIFTDRLPSVTSHPVSQTSQTHHVTATELQGDWQEDYFDVGKTLGMIQEICSRHVGDFDWFMLTTDDLYVRVPQLTAFLNHQDSKKKVYFGHEKPPIFDSTYKFLEGNSYCVHGPGVVLSRTAMSDLCGMLAACRADDPGNIKPHVLLSHCLRKYVGIMCTAENQIFMDSLEEDHMNRLQNYLTESGQPIALHPVKSPWTMDTLHMHYTEDRIRNIIRILNDTNERRRILTDGVDASLTHVENSVSEDVQTIEYQELVTLDSDFNMYRSTACQAVQKPTPALKAELHDVILLANTSLRLGEGLYCPELLSAGIQKHPRGTNFIVDLMCKNQQTSSYQLSRVHLQKRLQRMTNKKARQRKIKPEVVVVVCTNTDDVRLVPYILNLKNSLQTGPNRLFIYVLIRESSEPENAKSSSRSSSYSPNRNIDDLETWLLKGDGAFVHKTLRQTTESRVRVLQTLVRDIQARFPNTPVLVTGTNTNFKSEFLVKCKLLARGGKQMYYPYPVMSVLNSNKESDQPEISQFLWTNKRRPYCVHSSDMKSLVPGSRSILSNVERDKGNQIKVTRAVDFDVELDLV